MGNAGKLNPGPCRRRLLLPGDEMALYDICLQTGDAGKDATGLYEDKNLLGDLYVGPYLHYQPELAWVIEDDLGICGYLLGVTNTLNFQSWFLDKWLPRIQKGRCFPDHHKQPWTLDDALLASLFEFEFDRPRWLSKYSAHIHIELLPRIQRKGYGSRWTLELLHALREQGCSGVHLGMHPDNREALRFYHKMGFHLLERAELAWEETLYLGKDLMK